MALHPSSYFLSSHLSCWLEWLANSFGSIGASPRVISRHDLTKILYESLPADAQAKIIPNKRAATVTVEPESDLVTVTCRDGSSYTGNLIVGADGAHSLIREQMRLLALATAASSPDPGSKGVNEEKPYLSTYRCVWIRFPSSLYPDLEPGAARETHGYECATQLFQGEETGVVGLYEKLEKPTREWVRFTKEDEEAVIDRWGHLPMIKGSEMKLREIYDSRIESGLVSLEEGVLDHWSWDGRIVLAGDAAHKFTPSTGAGCNNGIIDVVVLANELEKALSGDSEPTKDELASVLHRYQSARYESVVDGCQQSGNATSMATWSSQVVKFIDTWVVPLRAFQKRAFRQGAELSALTPAFDFVPGEERIIGEVPWVKSIPLFVS